MPGTGAMGAGHHYHRHPDHGGDTGLAVYCRLATVLLAILTLVVAALTARTLLAVALREVCVEGH